MLNDRNWAQMAINQRILLTESGKENEHCWGANFLGSVMFWKEITAQLCELSKIYWFVHLKRVSFNLRPAWTTKQDSVKKEKEGVEGRERRGEFTVSLYKQKDGRHYTPFPITYRGEQHSSIRQ